MILSNACDGVGAAWWIDKTLELRSNAFISEPVTRICLVNYQTSHSGVAALCQFPQAALSGVRFRRGVEMHQVDRALLTAGFGRTILRNVLGVNFAPGDSKALPGAHHCDLLIADMASPIRRNNSDAKPSTRGQRQAMATHTLRRNDYVQSLLGGLGHALDATTRQPGSVVIMHGPVCNPKAVYQAADSSYKPLACWSSVFLEHAAAVSLVDAECKEMALNSTEANAAYTTCIGRVNPESPCSKTATPLLSKAGRLGATKTRVRFSTGLASADRLLARSARYFIAVPCGDDGSTSGDHPLSGSGSSGRVSGGPSGASGGPSGVRGASARVCLLFKDAPYETWVGGMASADGVRFEGLPRLLMPHLLRITEGELRASGQYSGYSRLASLTHNLAVLCEADGSYLMAGGKFHTHRPVGNGNTGIWLLRGTLRAGSSGSGGRSGGGGAAPWLLSLWAGTRSNKSHYKLLHKVNRTADLDASKGSAMWKFKREQPSLNDSKTVAVTPRLLFKGTHKGCIERRSATVAPWVIGGACEFDGRLSLVRHVGKAALPGAALPGAATADSAATAPPRVGGRLMLFTRANMAAHGQRHVQVTSSYDEGKTWSRFRLVRIEGHEPSSSDIYFFNVASNPVHNGSLLAVFPIVQHFQGCLCIAASLDGRRWSAPEPLTRCVVAGQRTASHPAAGLIERGDFVDLYMHEGVPGISIDMSTPHSLRKYLEAHERDSRLNRFSMPKAALRKWTLEAIATLPPPKREAELAGSD